MRIVPSDRIRSHKKGRGNPADDDEAPRIGEEDKVSVRDNLVEGIVRAPPAVRAQLGESAKHVVHFEFPDRWPALMPAVCALLTSQARSSSPRLRVRRSRPSNPACAASQMLQACSR